MYVEGKTVYNLFCYLQKIKINFTFIYVFFKENSVIFSVKHIEKIVISVLVKMS